MAGKGALAKLFKWENIATALCDESSDEFCSGDDNIVEVLEVIVALCDDAGQHTAVQTGTTFALCWMIPSRIELDTRAIFERIGILEEIT